MKLYRKIFAAIALIFVMFNPAGCSKNFLNPTDTFATTEAATFTKPQQVIDLVNAIYNTYQSSDMLKKSLWYYANFLTHDWFNNGNDIVWNYYGIGADFYALPTLWNNAYIGIARANAALEVIATTKANGILTPALADRLSGEAYFLRGMTYYYLAGSFGGVPLELKAETTGLTPRSSQDSVFTQVVADMKTAEGLLLSKTQLASTDIGRATTGAAYGFEGAAQMWLGNYSAALTAFTNQELTTNYSLVPLFVNVHEYNNQNNQESLYEVQFNVYGSQSWDGGWEDGGEEAWIDDFSWPQEISGFGYDYGNPGLWYSYQAGDPRRGLTIIGPGDSVQSPGIIAKWGGIRGYAVVLANYQSNPTTYSDGAGNPINTCGTLTHPWFGTDGTPRSGYYCSKKWRDPTLTGANGTSAIFGGQNQIMLRYAEILLDRAECKIHTGDASGAQADIMTVRNRAWAPNPAPLVMQDGLTWNGGATQPITDPMQQVLSEYRHELTGEYSLMYDLRRAGPGVDAAFIQAAYGTTSNTNQITYPYGPTADGKTHGVWQTTLPTNKDILPIPSAAIALNPYLKQNPSY